MYALQKETDMALSKSEVFNLLDNVKHTQKHEGKLQQCGCVCTGRATLLFITPVLRRVEHSCRHGSILADTVKFLQARQHPCRHVNILADTVTSFQTREHSCRHGSILADTVTFLQARQHPCRHVNILAGTVTSLQTR